MEIPYLPKTGLNKPDDSGRVELAKQKRVVATDKLTPQTDEVSLSSKAKLMANLRTQYDKLDDNQSERVNDLKDRIAQGTHNLSSEEVVTAILSGTMFAAV